MNVHKRAIAVVFLVATALGALGAPAMAAPMPWETSRVPAAPVTPVAPSVADGHNNTFTVQCAPPCYQ